MERGGRSVDTLCPTIKRKRMSIRIWDTGENTEDYCEVHDMNLL
jgi:anti-sigma regulatory factor (Ser/Thr protein kinase)